MSNKVISRQQNEVPGEPHVLTFNNPATGQIEAAFRFLPEIPGLVLLDLLGSMEQESAGSAKAIAAFIEDSLISDEEREAWKAYANKPENKITLGVLSEIVTWLAEKYSGIESPVENPTGPAGATTAHTGLPQQSFSG
jgi:hypothetical protein